MIFIILEDQFGQLTTIIHMARGMELAHSRPFMNVNISLYFVLFNNNNKSLHL